MSYVGISLDSNQLLDEKSFELRKLRNPRINLTDSLSGIIKAFQNPIWAEQARERLKQIELLTSNRFTTGRTIISNK